MRSRYVKTPCEAWRCPTVVRRVAPHSSFTERIPHTECGHLLGPVEPHRLARRSARSIERGRSSTAVLTASVPPLPSRAPVINHTFLSVIGTSVMSQQPGTLLEQKLPYGSVLFSFVRAHDSNAGAQGSIMICQNSCPILQIQALDDAGTRGETCMDSTKWYSGYLSCQNS